LESVGRHFGFVHNPVLSSVSMGSLISVGHYLDCISNAAMVSLSLPRLTHINKYYNGGRSNGCYLRSVGNHNNFMFDLPELKVPAPFEDTAVYCGYCINNGHYECTSSPSPVPTTPVPTSVVDVDIQIPFSTDESSPGITAGDVGITGGDVTVLATADPTKDQLPRLREIGGNLIVALDFDGPFNVRDYFPALRHIGGNIVIDGATHMTAFDLVRIGSAEQDEDETDGLVTIGGRVAFMANGAFKSIDMSGVKSIGGYVRIGYWNWAGKGNPVLQSVNMAALESVGGQLRVLSNPVLTSVSMGLVTSVGKWLECSENAALESLSLPRLTHINGEYDLPSYRPAHGCSIRSHSAHNNFMFHLPELQVPAPFEDNAEYCGFCINTYDYECTSSPAPVPTPVPIDR